MEFSKKVKKQARPFIRRQLAFDALMEKELDKNAELYRRKMAVMLSSKRTGPKPRTILAEGDSWMRYAAGFSIGYYIDRRRNTEVNNLAKPGDELSDILTARQRRRLTRELKSGPYRRHKYDGLVFSAGGNDLLGEGRFFRWLLDYQAGMEAKDVLNLKSLKAVFDFIEAGYAEVIAIRDKHSVNTKIYLNGYDFAQPNNIPVCGRGPWLRPHLNARGVPRRLQSQVVAEFLKKFNLRLKRIVRTHNNIELIATLGTLTPNEWSNEIHPTNRGFKKIASKFNDAIENDFPR